MRLTPADDARVAQAIIAAERRTDGEIQAIVAPSSDAYPEAPFYGALLIALLPLAVSAAFPRWLVRGFGLVLGGWEEPALHLLLTLLLIVTIVLFFGAHWLLDRPAIRLVLTPHATKLHRVRAEAIRLFKTGTEARTASATGVLLYLSLAERRAEIVADRTIHTKVADARWGEAMAAMLPALKDGHVGEGMAAAIAKIADILAEHFPNTGGDPNELPDRLIRL
jgi:putative membrane protein